MGLKIKKQVQRCCRFIMVNLGLFLPVVGLNFGMLRILFMSEIWSVCTEFIVPKQVMCFGSFLAHVFDLQWRQVNVAVVCYRFGLLCSSPIVYCL